MGLLTRAFIKIDCLALLQGEARLSLVSVWSRMHLLENRRELKGVSQKGLRRYFLSKKVFLCIKKVLERKKGFLRRLRKPSKKLFSF